MNAATQAGDVTRSSADGQIRVPTVRLPVYVRLMLLISAPMTILVIAWTTLLRQDVPAANPFSAYVEIWPGQPWREVIAPQFSCPDNPVTGESRYCTCAPADGPFSLVAVTIHGNIVQSVDFITRRDTLLLGDLPLSWGRPRIQVYGQSILLEWPDIGVKANSWAASRRFSYLMPVVRLSTYSAQAPG